MTNPNSTVIVSKSSKDLKVEEYPWANEYRGTEAALVESGLIKPEWLPGKPGNTKGRVSIGLVNGEMRILPARTSPTTDQEDKGFITIRKTSKGRFEVWIYCLKRERERRKKVARLEFKNTMIEVARKEMGKGIAELPTNADEFLWRQLRHAECMISVTRKSFFDGYGYSGGYGFSSDFMDEFDVAMERSIQTIKDAHIHFDQEKRQKEITDIRDRVLAKYPELDGAKP